MLWKGLLQVRENHALERSVASEGNHALERNVASEGNHA